MCPIKFIDLLQFSKNIFYICQMGKMKEIFIEEYQKEIEEEMRQNEQIINAWIEFETVKSEVKNEI